MATYDSYKVALAMTKKRRKGKISYGTLKTANSTESEMNMSTKVCGM